MVVVGVAVDCDGAGSVGVLRDRRGTTQGILDRGGGGAALRRDHGGGVAGIRGGVRLVSVAELPGDYRSGSSGAVVDGVGGGGVLQFLAGDQGLFGFAVGVVDAGGPPGQAAGVVDRLGDQAPGSSGEGDWVWTGP